jgi:hypothetical protein
VTARTPLPTGRRSASISMLVCTREPSGSRASTQGDIASTRSPRAHDAFDHVRTASSPLKQTVAR